jgi:hypothetical protein
MEMKYYEYHNVDPKTGKVPEGGAVETQGRIMFSENEGCGLPSCHCSDGYWLSVVLPITKNGTVRGITVYFDDAEEYFHYKRTHALVVNV